MAGMGIGSFLSGMSGGMQMGMSIDRNKKISEALENRQSQQQGGQAPMQQGSLGLPGQQQPSATGAMGYNPTQSPVLQSSPATKAETNNNGIWQTIASYF